MMVEAGSMMGQLYAQLAQHGQAICAFSAVASGSVVRDTRSMDFSDQGRPYHEWLKDELAKPGRSQSALGRFLGVDSSSINRLVNGKREPRLREMNRIDEYLQSTDPAAKSVLAKKIPTLTIAKLNDKAELNESRVHYFRQTYWILRRAIEHALFRVACRHEPPFDEPADSVNQLAGDAVLAVCALHLFSEIDDNTKRVLLLYCRIGSLAEQADNAGNFPNDDPEALSVLNELAGPHLIATDDPVEMQMRFGLRAAQLADALWGPTDTTAPDITKSDGAQES